MASKRRAQKQHTHRGRRGLAEPHAEVKYWLETKFVKQGTMAGFGRNVRGQAMVERIGPQAGERRHRGGANKTVEQHWNSASARGERGAEKRREFVAPEGGGDRERVAEDIGVNGERAIHGRLFAPEPLVVDAGPTSRPAPAAAAE